MFYIIPLMLILYWNVGTYLINNIIGYLLGFIELIVVVAGAFVCDVKLCGMTFRNRVGLCAHLGGHYVTGWLFFLQIDA